MISYNADSTDFSNYLPVIQKMIDSFATTTTTIQTKAITPFSFLFLINTVNSIYYYYYYYYQTCDFYYLQFCKVLSTRSVCAPSLVSIID
jgi:hypothetical protein